MTPPVIHLCHRDFVKLSILRICDAGAISWDDLTEALRKVDIEISGPLLHHLVAKEYLIELTDLTQARFAITRFGKGYIEAFQGLCIAAADAVEKDGAA